MAFVSILINTVSPKVLRYAKSKITQVTEDKCRQTSKSMMNKTTPFILKISLIPTNYSPAPVGDRANRSPTRAAEILNEILFHNNQFLCIRELLGLQFVEINTTRQ
jgi:hypothetical protein